MNIIYSSIRSLFNLFNNNIYVLFEDEWYNINELQKLHPNGENIFPKFNMKDITIPFKNNKIHEGIKSPKSILEKYKITNKSLIDKLNNKFYYNLIV